MIACVSPPQLSTSHIVQPAANMAQAASMALPPCVNIIAPAFAESGLPVIAIQFLACNGGFCVFCAMVETVKSEKKRREGFLIKNGLAIKGNVVSNMPFSMFRRFDLRGHLTRRHRDTQGRWISFAVFGNNESSNP